jgi:hypothetical protein
VCVGGGGGVGGGVRGAAVNQGAIQRPVHLPAPSIMVAPVAAPPRPVGHPCCRRAEFEHAVETLRALLGARIFPSIGTERREEILGALVKLGVLSEAALRANASVRSVKASLAAGCTHQLCQLSS